MPTAKTQIKFKYGLQENYTKLTAKDANTLYFATDTQRLFVGDVEYTRPVITGTSAPTMDSPLNTLFYNTSTKILYTNTADGWITVATNFSLSTTGVTAGTYGDTTAQTPTHGTTFKVPSFTVDTFGRLTDAKEHTVKLPAETQLSKGEATIGTATKLKHGDEFTVETDISVSGHAVTPEKTTFTLPTETTLSKGTATTGTAQAPAHGKSFIVITDVNVSGHTVTPEKTTITLPAETAETPVSVGTAKTDKVTAEQTIEAITALTASGHVVTPTVTTITLPSVGTAAAKDFTETVTAGSANLVTSGAVSSAISTAISGVTQFDIQVVTALPTTGKKGVIYLIADTHSDDNDSYDEYIWNTAIETPAFEKIGNTDVNLSGYIEKVKSAEGYVPKFNADGALVSTGFTLGKSVPASAVFTDTKVTAVGNHYTPSGGTTTSASGGEVTDITNGTGVQVVTGVTKDAAGHVTGITSVGLKSVNTNTDTKVNMKARGTTKAYLLGTSTAPTASNQAVESLAETDVYFDTTAGTLVATTFEGALSGNATSATKATQDGDGKVIKETYATKSEVTNATLVWESF